MTGADALRRLLTPVEPVYALALDDGWERVPTTDPRLADRLTTATSRMTEREFGALQANAIDAVTLPVRDNLPLAVPILERRVRGERFGTLDALVDERLAAGAQATLGDPAILRHRSREDAEGVAGYVVRYLLATPGTERKRGVEFIVAFPLLADERLQKLELLYDGIIASGAWRVPATA